MKPYRGKYLSSVLISILSVATSIGAYAFVDQETFLFDDTVLENIRLGCPAASDADVIHAAKQVGCDDFISALPKGYLTRVGTAGNQLSGGEKQRISIARAILKDAPIIILDEATSALDAENEQDILSAIDQLTANKTVIMIAHRIKSVQKADKIIALKDGQIVQEGTHDQLKNTSGLYADFLASREAAAQWKINV